MENKKTDFSDSVYYYKNQTKNEGRKKPSKNKTRHSSGDHQLRFNNEDFVVLENISTISSLSREHHSQGAIPFDGEMRNDETNYANALQGVDEERRSQEKDNHFQWKVEICKNLSKGRIKQEQWKVEDQRVCEENAVKSNHVDDNSFVLGGILLIFPIGALVIALVFILLAFTVAESQGSYKKHRVPYISDLGNFKPQSSIFTMGLVLSSFCTAWIVIIRYIQVQANVLPYTNCASMTTGIILILGKITASSFQLSSLLIVHLIGSLLYFGAATLFCGIQAYITFILPLMHSRILAYTRIVATSIMVLCCFVFGVFLLPSLESHNKVFYIAQAAEWTFAVFKVLFMFSFVVDFWKIEARIEMKDRNTRKAER